MIWRICVLKSKVEGTPDALGNPTITWKEELTTQARLTPYDSRELGLEQRKLTSDSQYFVLPIPYSAFPACQRADIGNIAYDIEEVIDLSPRYTVIGCKVYKR